MNEFSLFITIWLPEQVMLPWLAYRRPIHAVHPSQGCGVRRHSSRPSPHWHALPPI